jgi:hypothetical protein
MPVAMRPGFVVLLLVACVSAVIGLWSQVLVQVPDHAFVIYRVEGPDGPRIICGSPMRINDRSHRVIEPEQTALQTR